MRAAARDLFDAGYDIVAVVIEAGVGTELARSGKLLVTRGGYDHLRAERLGDRQARTGDAAADPPEQDPLLRLESRLGREHAVGRLEHERKGRRGFEVEPIRNRINL